MSVHFYAFHSFSILFVNTEDELKLPCEFCEKLILAESLDHHQVSYPQSQVFSDILLLCSSFSCNLSFSLDV